MRIAKECLRRGHQVDVFTMQWQGEKEIDLPVHLIQVKGLQNHARIKHFGQKIPALTSGYDLVVGFNKMPGLDVYYAADTCYQAKVRAQRPVWYRLTPRYRQLMAAEHAVFSAKNTTQILLIAERQQEEFQRYYATEKQRFHLLPPGIARDRMRPEHADDIRQAARQTLLVKENEMVVLAIGSGFKTKGLDRSILAVAALPDELRTKTCLYVIGTDHPKYFRSLAKKYGIADQIKFLGGRNDIPELLLAGDLLLHPAYNENTGTVLLEALAAGLPVLTTDVCGYAHYVTTAQAGKVIVSPFQQAQLNQSLQQMLSSNQRIQWQQNAIMFSRAADIYSMPMRTVDLLESFVKG